LKFINIPTTLLAQVDASVGGKTAINSSQGKNLIGTFYQPDFVLIDISLLSSLPQREMICGYGEILKHSIILDRNFFLWLSKNAKKIINLKNKKLLKIAIMRSCKIKSEIVNKDEREKNLRMILNFGHTFAHGFESAKNFSKKLNHGEAVLLGMMTASQLSYQKKLLSLEDLTLIKKHYLNLNLPMKFEKIFKKQEINKIIHFMKKDKKNLNEKINLILLKKIGKTTKPNSLALDSDEIKKFLVSNYC
jgi:3-dehydroquinate synthase/shikimate kinase/3-dehydroquinate synthase